MFFLLRGVVHVCSRDNECIFATLHQGSFFGEIGILFSIPRTANIIADTKCCVACLTAETLQSILPQYPQVEKVIRFEAEERLSMLHKKRLQYVSAPGETGRRRSEELVDKDSFVKSSIYENICHLQIFAECTNEDLLHMIALNLDSKQFKPHKRIFERNEVSSDIYFIISGTVEVIAPVCTDEICSSTENVVVSRLGPTSHFGEIAAMLNVPRPADVRTITDVDCYVLTQAKLRQVAQHFPRFASRMKEMAEDRLEKLRHLQATYDFSSHNKDEQSEVPESVNNMPKAQDDDSQRVPVVNHHCVDKSTICSTSSDQDPTLSSHVSKMRDMRTRKRRASVAVWSDPNLLAFAEQKAAEPTIQRRPPSWFTDTTSDENQSDSGAQSDVSNAANLISMKDEVLVRILQFVDFATKLKFREVCRRAESLLTSQASRPLFKEVDLSPWNKKMTDAYFIPISMFLESRVKDLNLTNCFHLTFKSFSAISEYNSRLINLNLHSCWELSDNSLASLATGCPYLTDIDLSNCRKITDRGIHSLFSTARQNISGEEELASNLSEMSVDGHSAASTPPATSGITRIALSYCKNLTDTSMRYMAEFGAETLVFINFQRCTTITDAGFESWQPGSFKRLESVILNDCTFLTDRAISSLVRAAPNIRYMSLSFCCALTDNSIEVLAQHLKQLEHIDASFCGAAVSDASVQALVQEGLPNLKEIIVRGCVRVTDSSVYALLAIARQLHLLNISQCQSVTMETKSMLQHYQIEGEDCPQVVV
ncbi:hypothetical protein NQZ79_g1248 [Umbelopsis isabellina]|nr:hypothetical protein NQZ79_g1248 [Umbelopsis isabellina]